jgi:hypothetical protein
MSDTRKIIDYTFDENAVGVRDALYAAIHDRVTAHIEDKKQEIARGLIAQHDEEVDMDPEDDDNEPEDEDDLEEAVAIDELSKKTLGSYIKKASDRKANHDRDAGEMGYTDAGDTEFNKGQARRKGIYKAIDRLTKEDVGEMHPDASKVLKHIKPEHHSKYTAHLQKGTYTGSYSDRAAVLGAAERAGHAVSEPSPFDVLDKTKKYKSRIPDSPGKKAGFSHKRVSTGDIYRRDAIDEPATPSK